MRYGVLKLMLKSIHLFLGILFLVFGQLSVHAIDDLEASSETYDFRKKFAVGKLSQAPTIDGVLSPGEWDGATMVDDMHQVRPIDHGKVSLETKVYVAYDADFLYISAYMYDDRPDLMNARIMNQGSSVRSDDAFKMTLSPYNNGQSGYFFKTNLNGVRDDGLFEGSTGLNFNWDTIWYTKSSKVADGWTTEIAIPFKSISFDPDITDWGISFGREIPRLKEYHAWSSYNRRMMPDAVGDMSGMIGAQQGKGLDIVTGLSVRRKKDYEAGEEGFSVDPSADIFYKITPSLTAVATINTDFSATEVDDQVVSLSRFSIFLPEKRDFFLQDADIFTFGRIHGNSKPFFSRTIGLSSESEQLDLRFGGKLTGRVGEWDIGVLDVVQEQEGGGNANLLVSRVQRHINEDSRAGMILTYGDPITGEGNYTAGMDYNYRSKSLIKDRLVDYSVWAMKTSTAGLEGKDKSFGYNFDMPSSNGYYLSSYGSSVQENFDPALGFVNRPGINVLWNMVGYAWRPDNIPYVRQITPEVRYVRHWKIGAGLEDIGLHLRPISITFDTSDRFEVLYKSQKENLRETFEIFDGIIIPIGEYSFDSIGVTLDTSSDRPYGIRTTFETGDYYGGSKRHMDAGIRYQPNKHFKLIAFYGQNDIKLPEGDFKTKQYKLIVNLAFNGELSWKTQLQYNNIDREATINSRLRYNAEPGRDYFFIINHGAIRDDVTDRFEAVESTIGFKIGHTMRF